MPEIIPRPSADANLEAAVDFLAKIADGGRLSVVAIAPDRGVTAAQVFNTSQQRDELSAWLREHNGTAGCYYTLNEPREEAAGRRAERDGRGDDPGRGRRSRPA